MKSLRLLAVTVLALTLACATNRPALASILIQIDKPTQTMTVSVDGAVRYRWYVSTGATGFSTPAGTYKPFRMEVMHYSNAPLHLLHLARTRRARLRPSRPRHAGIARMCAPDADQRRHALPACRGAGHGGHHRHR
jgi:hypothetical protein